MIMHPLYENTGQHCIKKQCAPFYPNHQARREGTYCTLDHPLYGRAGVQRGIHSGPLLLSLTPHPIILFQHAEPQMLLVSPGLSHYTALHLLSLLPGMCFLLLYLHPHSWDAVSTLWCLPCLPPNLPSSIRSPSTPHAPLHQSNFGWVLRMQALESDRVFFHGAHSLSSHQLLLR